MNPKLQSYLRNGCFRKLFFSFTCKRLIFRRHVYNPGYVRHKAKDTNTIQLRSTTMKIYASLLLATSALVGTSYGCANQAVYDLCLKTGQAALGACGPAASNAKCACAAQKQILACYSECPDDASVFGKLIRPPSKFTC
jgi:hypothetical protein